jgi:hypothetical protein
MKYLSILLFFTFFYLKCFSQEYYKPNLYIDQISIYGKEFDSDAVIEGFYNISSIRKNYKFNLNVANPIFERLLIKTLVTNKHKFLKKDIIDTTQPCKIMIDFKYKDSIIQSIFIDANFIMGIIDYKELKINYYTNGLKLVCFLKTILPYYFYEGIQGFCKCKK